MTDRLLPINLPVHPDAGVPVVAGPCSAESRSQVLETARGLHQARVEVLRAGVWKPRTMPGGFEGAGQEALDWLIEAKRQYGMMTAVEVATPEHVSQALEAGVDILWIGARTTANPFAVQALADAVAHCSPATPVLIKNPVSPDIDLWDGAIQRFLTAGVRHLGAIHRGFSTLNPAPYRNSPLWSIAMDLQVRYPSLPILTDPSHMGGTRQLVGPLAQEAIDMGFAGLVVESHCSPQEALSDASQQLTPEDLGHLLRSLIRRGNHVDTAPLHGLREQIDLLDEELLSTLAKRMAVSREIGRVKENLGMPVLQSSRFRDVIDSRMSRAKDLRMSPEFLRSLMLAVHEESVRQQVEELKKH